MLNIWGFMGSGKSTLGRYVAQVYQWKHIDSDERIEQAEGLSIPELFARYGESYFRQKETDFLARLVRDQQESDAEPFTVLTTGGGMPLREENRQYLRQLGPSVYLHVSFEEIVRRLAQDDQRPLWNERELAKMKQRYHERLSIYRTADHIIEADHYTVAQVAEQLKNVIRA